MRRPAGLTSSRYGASGAIRFRRLFADVFGNDVLPQLSLRLRLLRQRDSEGRAEIPNVATPAYPVYGHHWHSWQSRQLS
jgi:hypothetical protein